MEAEIVSYQEHMKDEVAGLFQHQYGVDKSEFSELMDNFYDHPYQQKKCIRVVALDKEKVIGFQSFFYWPYAKNGQIFNSFQSGNSLVHPDYRGKGIFQKLLLYIDTNREKLGIDFLVGFPVEASKNSFLRNGWTNILDLYWYVKISNPLSLILPLNHGRLSRTFPFRRNQLAETTTADSFRLNKEPSFSEWQAAYQRNNRYYTHHYQEGTRAIHFSMKIQVRKFFIKELIIGDVIASEGNPEFVRRAFADLCKKAFSCGCISMISIALNRTDPSGLIQIIESLRFKGLNRKIYFIVKPFSNPSYFLNPSFWQLYRSDIDTW